MKKINLYSKFFYFLFQIICKLHVFEKERKVWLEKGRGTLRLNDICQTEGCFQSRLGMLIIP